MVRNEYRRAYIMLRAARQGYGGHVRLERRTLTGSMFFTVTAPQSSGALSAALAGQRNGEYYAAPVGTLSRDRRGQLSLAWQFDPRGIDARPLEAYAWVVVVATDAPCAVVLTGNVEGSREMDPVALSRAVCALFAPAPEPAADIPEAEAPAADETAPTCSGGLQAATDSQAEDETAPTCSGGLQAATPNQTTTESDIRIYTRSRARPRREARAKPVSDAQSPDVAASDAGASDAPPQTPSDSVAPAQAAEEPDAPAPAPLPDPSALMEAAASVDDGAAPTPVTAARRLGLDITVPWPGSAEAVRRLFATQAPAEDVPEDGYIYVRAPMPDASGYRESLVGLKVDHGQITGLRYALPARRAPEPPPGLEDYRWAALRGEDGFWVTDAPLETGATPG